MNEFKTKTANIAKVHFLMKEKGMSAMDAIKAAYPSWPDEKIKALAVKLEAMKGAGKAMASGGPMMAKKEEPKEEEAEKEASSKNGLWAHIHAKKQRGEKSDPSSKEYQEAKKAGQKINREAEKKASVLTSLVSPRPTRLRICI